jgi:DNA-binding phage protein
MTTQVHLLHLLEAARIRRDRQEQAIDLAALEARAAGCNWSEMARAAGMTRQGLRKRLSRLSS